MTDRDRDDANERDRAQRTDADQGERYRENLEARRRARQFEAEAAARSPVDQAGVDGVGGAADDQQRGVVESGEEENDEFPTAGGDTGTRNDTLA